MIDSINTEARRMAFLVNRDGKRSAIKWALRTARLYRKAVLDKRHYASNPEYRRMFIESYLYLKRFALDTVQ